MDNQNYKVVKSEKPLRILQDTAPARPGEFTVFLDKFSRSGSGEETLREFLDHQSGFIPVKDRETGRLSLINLKEVVYLQDKEPLIATVRGKIRLTLKGGLQMEVIHFRDLPKNHSRMLDYLNSEGLFISFAKDGAEIFINRSKIMRSEEYA